MHFIEFPSAKRFKQSLCLGEKRASSVKLIVFRNLSTFGFENEEVDLADAFQGLSTNQ